MTDSTTVPVSMTECGQSCSSVLTISNIALSVSTLFIGVIIGVTVTCTYCIKRNSSSQHEQHVSTNVSSDRPMYEEITTTNLSKKSLKWKRMKHIMVRYDRELYMIGHVKQIITSRLISLTFIHSHILCTLCTHWYNYTNLHPHTHTHIIVYTHTYTTSYIHTSLHAQTVIMINEYCLCFHEFCHQ